MIDANDDFGAVIDEIVERLRDRFPHASREAVREAVEQARGRFAHARVTDFVPLFVEREARTRLAQSAN